MRFPSFATLCAALCLASPAVATCPGPSCPSQPNANSAILGAIVGSIISARPDAGPDAPRRPTRATSSRQTPEAQRAENRLIQTKLNALGHDTGTPDGLIGRKTRAAITSWQASIGAAPTGTLTPAQRRLLLGQRSAPPRAPMIASTPTPVAPTPVAPIPAEPDTD